MTTEQSKNARASGKARLLREQEAKREAAIKNMAAPAAASDATPATPPQDTSTARPSSETKPTETPAASPPPPPAAAPPASDTPATQGAVKKDDTAIKSERKAIDHESGEYDKATEAELYKERLRVLQGKYEAEVPRLSQQVKDLKEHNATLKAENEELKKKGAPSSTNRVAAKVENSAAFRRIVGDYDEETANDIRELLADMVSDLAPASDPPPSPPEPAQPSTSPTKLGSYREFEIVLNSEVPDWQRNYDQNDAFIDWAEKATDPSTGLTMLQLLNKAALEDFDTAVARRIFSTFDRQVGKQPGSTETTGHDHMVEPAGDGGAGTSQPDAPTFRAGQLKQMQDLLRRHKITQEKFDAFQRDFVQAQNEGRVTA